MADETVLSNLSAIAALNAIVDRVDAGGGAGYVIIYSGTKPADADTAITDQVALATFILPATAFGAAADDTPGAIATAAAIDPVTIGDDGTASFFRVFNFADAPQWDGNCGTSDASMILNTVNFVTGAEASILSWLCRHPES